MKQLLQLLQALFCITLIVVSSFSTTQGQMLPGSNDPNFNKTDIAYGAGEGFNGGVYSLVTLPDGKMLAGGSFTSFNTTASSGITRLHADGTLDATFNTGTGFDGAVYAIAVQPDGKIMVAGSFTLYNGTLRRNIARLNADGSLDESFNPEVRLNNDVLSMVLQPDGKVIVGGAFTASYGNVPNRIARFNADGSLDTSFNPGQGFNNYIRSMVLQPDGKVVVGGYFSTYNGVSRNRIARLNDDGSLDATFNIGTGFTGLNSSVRALALQPDGKIVAGGAIWQYNGINRSMIARLNADGSLDNSFNPVLKTGTSNGFNAFVSSVALRSDGKIMVGGEFIAFYSNSTTTNINRIARLHTNGSLDTSFNPGEGFNFYDDNVFTIAVLPDNKVIVGGVFLSYDGVSRSRIARLSQSGSLDTSFNPDTGASNIVYSIVMQPDGKMLIGGSFVSYNDIASKGIARLHTDGTIDTSFDTDQGFNHTVKAIALQPDGKVVVGGSFISFNGTPRRNIARLNADGSLDDSFTIGTGFTEGYITEVTTIALQPDGKIVVGGDFRYFNGTARRNIVRLNTDGSLDASFDPGYGFDGRVCSIALQTDGKIMVGGAFSSSSYSIARNKLARLKADGSLDNSFYSIVHLNSTVYSVTVQADGKTVVGGAFTDNNQERNRIIRLNDNGTQDATFITGAGFDNTVYAVALQPDGKMIIGGEFTSFNGTSTNRIARLNADGSLDTSLDTGNGFNNTVSAVALQPDDMIVAGGSFFHYNDIPRKRIARLYGVEGTLLSAENTEEKKLNVQIYPNPSSGDINVVLNDLSAKTRVVEAVLYNNLAQPVLQQAINPMQVQARAKLPTTHLPAGVYYLKVTWNGRTVSRQVVLQR